MAEVIWTQRALKDINEIAEYIAKDSLQYAEEQLKQFFERAITRFAKSPALRSLQTSQHYVKSL